MIQAQAQSSISADVKLDSTLNASPMFMEYFALQQHYEKKYGTKTIVVMQKGAFYEMYQYKHLDEERNITIGDIDGNVAIRIMIDDSKHRAEAEEFTVNLHRSIGQAIKVANVLRMKLTSTNASKPHSITNPYMLGFPKVVYTNHKDTLLLNGFTIIRVDEVGTNPDKSKIRRISEITSPGTDVDSITTYSPIYSNTLVSMYIEFQTGKKNIDRTILTCGLSYIDVASGTNAVSEVYSKETDENYALYEMFRFLSNARPSEIIIHMNKFPESRLEEYKKHFIDNLELNKYPKFNIYTTMNPQLKSVDYQEHLLNMLFPLPVSENQIVQPGTQGIMNVFERLNLQLLHYGKLSYMNLLIHCYEHHTNLINLIQKPNTEWTDENQNLMLTHNAAQQLNLYSTSDKLFNDTLDCLQSVLDNCSTVMGSRFLRRKLLNPITNIDILNNYYQMTDDLIKDDTNLIDRISKILSLLPDIQRLQRLIQLDLINPKDFTSLLRGYCKVLQLNTLLMDSQLKSFEQILIKSSDLQAFEDKFKQLNIVLNLEHLAKVKFKVATRCQPAMLQCKDNFVNPGYYKHIDDIHAKNVEYWGYLDTLCGHFNTITRGGRSKDIAPSIERKTKKEEDSDEMDSPKCKIMLTCTNAKATAIKNSPELNTSLTAEPVQVVKIKSNESAIVSPAITEICNRLEYGQQQLENELLKLYISIIKEMQTSKFFDAINSFINNLDFVHNNARLAIRHKYYKPQIVVTPGAEQEISFIRAKDLRHPLIERIIRQEYITNDIELGQMLLYGINSCGKSSLARALGISLVMAQCGMYVAGKLEYYPYRKIITRLSGNDDLMKGQSSFMVEMYELNIILKNADSRTLVLGDELSKGTESGSGTGLTVATLEELHKRKTSFIFSTHMHHLVDMHQIKDLTNMQVCHLEAVYDQQLDMLVYERKIKPGSGSSLYGLEVCKNIQLGDDFISRAMQIRDEFLKTPGAPSGKRSNYNNGVIVHKCQVCGSTENLNTHHLQEQNKADDNGMIEHYHKNSAFNLLVLCEDCHQKLHKGQLQLTPKQTLQGTIIIKQ